MPTPIRHERRNLTEHYRNAVGALATEAAANLQQYLGDKHTFTRLIAVKRGAASTGETLVIQQTHDITGTPTWVSCPNLALTGLVASPASAATMVVAAVPTAPHVRALYTNGTGAAQTALVLELTAMDG